MSQGRPVAKRGPPTVPAGLAVRGGAAAITRAMQSPHNVPGGGGRDAALMPPPPLPGSAGSMSSSVSSRPSFSSSDSGGSVSAGSAFFEPRHSQMVREDRLKVPLQESMEDNLGGADLDTRFENLLERLQVPSTVRIKFSSVTSDVKMSILESSLSSNPNILASLGLAPPVSANNNTNNNNSTATGGKKLKNRLSTPLLRKPKSSQSLRDDVHKEMTSQHRGHQRGQSMDVPRSVMPPSGRPTSISIPPSSGRQNSVPISPRAPPSRPGTPETPDVFVRWLANYKATDIKMEVDRAKKLRMLLRHEVTTWVAAFLDAGGYARILDRIQDLLDVEWREEQHDDKMLYELLRCVKALTTSDVGKAALRAHHPRPFVGLSELLFSEKKPGDLACRQIIVELWLFHFELFPSSSQEPRRQSTIRFQPEPSLDITAFIRSLLMPENKDDKTKDYHEFVTAAHRPRIFKAWVQELSDICRDYFWIMCHGSNTLWALNEVNEQLVERPVAPGGATGGVEFEAMGYVTIHFRLLNALALQTAEESVEKARQLHHDLLVSGLDRILITMRKASTTYYPTLHLELARYVDALRRASPGNKLPYLISKMVGPPPEELRQHRSASEWLPSASWDRSQNQRQAQHQPQQQRQDNSQRQHHHHHPPQPQQHHQQRQPQNAR